jgi:branched-chain amino acid transport system substrate-binding protein
MNNTSVRRLMVALAAGGFTVLSSIAHADEVLKFGVSVPLTGSGANWGKGNEFMCKKAAQEIKDTGGIKVKGKTYNLECLAYDNKYTAAEGTKVAQTLLNRDGVKYLYVFGTPPLLASQALTERQGVLLFNGTWALNSKGPNFPLTFSGSNSPFEMVPAMISYVASTHPQAKTVVLLNVNDSSGRDTERVQRPTWEKHGVKVLTSDYFERGTTEFQPIALRLMSQKPDIIDLGTTPLADAGQVFKELDVLGFKGVKVLPNGNAAEGLMATAGAAGNGVYMGGAVPFDGPSATAHQRKVNEEARALLGESLGFANIIGYDVVYMLKAGMEKAQSLEPKDIAAAIPSTKFRTFYGAEVGYGGKATYGSVQQPLLPVYISQVTNGKLVEKAKIVPKE